MALGTVLWGVVDAIITKVEDPRKWNRQTLHLGGLIYQPSPGSKARPDWQEV
jgi:hypothetical protein